MFSIFPVMFGIVFLAIMGIIIFTIIKGITEWNKNNNSPVLIVDATVVAKRTDVSHHTHSTGNDAMDYHSTSTRYYVTFQVESGDRMEFYVPDNEFGMLVEGDAGRLTFQGTRYKGFQRKYETERN